MHMTKPSVSIGMFALAVLFAFSAISVDAQVSGGVPQWVSTSGGPDVINLANLNMNLSIPMVHRQGRQENLDFGINYNSAFYQPLTVPGTGLTWTPVNSAMGWSEGGSGLSRNYISAYTFSYAACSGLTDPEPQLGTYTWSNFIYVDNYGQTHPFVATLTYTYCTDTPQGFTGFSNQGEGVVGDLTLSTTTVNPGDPAHSTVTLQISVAGGPAATVPWIVPNGTLPPNASSCVTYPCQPSGAADLNGNFIGYGTESAQLSLVNGVWQIPPTTQTYYDTLGNSDVSVQAGVNGYDGQIAQYGAVTSNNGNAYPGYGSYKIQTNFNCSGVSEYTATSPLLNSLTLPDGRRYVFAYETGGAAGTTTGRISQITLPGGGTITYNYTLSGGSSINCSTGSPLGFTRKVTDGNGNSNSWTFSMVPVNGTASVNTVVTDPTGASVTHTIGPIINGSSFPTSYGKLYAETGTVVKDASGNVLTSTAIIFNGTTTPNGVPGGVFLPIASRQTNTSLPSAAAGVTSEVMQDYNTVGMPTETDVYDFGASGSGNPGALISKTITTYPVSPNLIENGLVFDRPSSVTTYGPNGTTVIAQTNYVYDGAPVVATSGVPAHSAGSNYGNVTTVKRLISGTNNFLTTNYTYNDTGTVATSTDPNGAITNYTYNQCSGSLLGGTSTQVKAGGQSTVALASSQTITCSTATVATSTDLNGNVTTPTYADNYKRVTSVVDPFGNQTTYTYPSTTANTSSVSSPYSGTNVLKSVTTYDGLGRPILQQTLQTSGGSNYDSVATAYNSVGLPSYSSMPYTGTLGQYTISGPGTHTTYDGAGRPLQITDGGGGYTQYAYSGNDVTVTTGPAPTGESVKLKTLQVDGSGALTSVCEVTSVSTAIAKPGACGQTVAQTGFLTTYTRVPGTVTVKQNVQPGSTGVQTRTQNFDLLGRVTLETIPELGSNGTPGTITYAYDSDPTGKCTGTYLGDLVYKKDTAGNITCITYDNQHRPLSVAPYTGTGAGPQASVTAQQRYVYDTGSFSGTALQNAMGNLAEAYTCASGSSCTTKLTDLLSSTFPETSGSTDTGRVTKQVWESTPNSSGYFTSQETLYPNGATGLLSATKIGWGSPLFPSLSYTLDSEGRPYTVTDTTNSINLVTATAYALPTSVSSVTYGNGDVDSYTPDPNTGRVTSFKNAIAAGTPFNMAGTLTWNQNSTLHQFAWTDSNDSTKNQTCTYSSDALNRLATANCGTVWNQTFAYDPFGNVNKAANGGVTYNATYNTATNQVSGGASANYDANGNQTLTNGVASLVWDANHNPVTAGSTGMTYDALGRLVEFTGSKTVQVVWGPMGEKLMLFPSSGPVLGTVALPGGGEAYYSTASLTAIRHKDWLGSSRLSTTWAHAIYSKTAYAPFGEAYNTAGTSDQDFTGKTQDSVATLTDFPYRKFDSNAGRWTAPDPGAWSVVDFTNPQSFNRYAYVMNGPMYLVDSLGLDPCPPGQNSCDPCYQGTVQCGGETVNVTDTPFVTVPYNPSDPNQFTITVNGISYSYMITDLTAYLAGGFYSGSGLYADDGFQVGTISFGGQHSVGQMSQQSPGGGNAGVAPIKPKKPCFAVANKNQFSFGTTVSAGAVNPFTSGGGKVEGINPETFGGATNTYTYTGSGAGLDVGASIQAVGAWGSGDWGGPFRSVNFSIGPFAGSIFWSPGKGGWVGGSWGLGAGFPGAAYEETTYTCRNGQ